MALDPVGELGSSKDHPKQYQNSPYGFAHSNAVPKH